MTLKYVRHETIGFIVWPRTDDLWHSDVGRLLQGNAEGKIVSAGFVKFNGGAPTCYGRSESLGIDSQQGDSEALATQLGLMPADAAAKP